jgi:rfaE bifunctional protein kinase chain/domain
MKGAAIMNDKIDSLSDERFQKIVSSFKTLGKIAIVGDVGIDRYTQGQVRRISPEAPVPIVEVEMEWEKLGLSANIAHNLKELGISSTICSVIGDDRRASRFESLLEESSLSTWGIVRDPTKPTVYKERIITSAQQVCRIDYEDKTPIHHDVEVKLLERFADFVKDHDAIILEDYAKGTLTENVIKKIINLGREKKCLICVDPGTSTPPLFYKGASLLKPNLKEAKLMVESLGYTYEEKSVEQMAEILIDKLDLDKLVITLGAQGMALLDRHDKNGLLTIPTVAQEVFDVSGAGDTTISLLTAGLLAGASLCEAAWIGNCGAGVVVAKKGTATVNQEELKIFFNRLKGIF